MSGLSKCCFCKKMFKNVMKHEENCPYQLKVIIGPQQERVICSICNRQFYRNDTTTYDYKNNKLCTTTHYGIYKHLKFRHRIEEDIDKYCLPIPRDIENELTPDEPINLNPLVIEGEGEIRNILGTNYQINEYGQVFSRGKKLKPKTSFNHKNVCFDLYLDGTRIHKSVAKLVAEAFIENPNNYENVIHKDRNKLNNHYSNLEWSEKREKIFN